MLSNLLVKKVTVLIISVSSNLLINIHHTAHMEPQSKLFKVHIIDITVTITITTPIVIAYNIRILVTIITVTNILILLKCKQALTGLNRDPFITT